uniref:Uncharacterized protein n=1 Tax=Poecilia latipinna TaxID=48699 RepID=A0A3B3VI95_9TELE
VYAVCSIFAIGVTIQLPITVSPQGFIKGAVSDHERCTALTEKVLRDHGSSVVAALCLGVVHPHVSGVGGGGVMLIHNACWNQTEVINFQGSAPKTLTEDVVQNASDIKVSYLHTLWDDVVSRVADVARDGFNPETEKLAGRFRDILIPNGQTLRLRLGSYPRMPSLAEVLEAGLGTFIEEKVIFVQGNGGVLTREEIHNYTVEVQQPMEGKKWYSHFLTFIYLSPPPSVGAVLISAPNLEQCFSTIFGPQRMPHASTSTIYPFPNGQLTGQVEVMGPDDLMVSVASGPFVGRIITESGVILKSLILDFFWPNQRTGQPQSNQLGKRPLTFLRPAVMVLTWNKCGTYMALSLRLEMLCNPQLFSAICELTPGDLVVIRYKKGHVPGMVKNLMQIGKKESKDDLNMLGFEVEFVVSLSAFLFPQLTHKLILSCMLMNHEQIIPYGLSKIVQRLSARLSCLQNVTCKHA